MRRLLLAVTLGTALAVPASFVTVNLLSSSAGAATAPSCKKLTGGETKTFKISSCTPKSANNKSASGSSVSLATGGGTIKWSPSKGGTTTVSVSFTQSGTSCPGGTEYVVSGSVTGGTSTYTATGQSVSADVCVKGGKLSLVKGTSMDL
jgi:hypothetical protein